MKKMLIENMMTGFPTKKAARATAAAMTEAGAVLVAEYYDANNEKSGKLTPYGGTGHCVRLVVEVDDVTARLKYHRKEATHLKAAECNASNAESAAWNASSCALSDHYGDLRRALDETVRCHNQIIVDLGGDA